MGARVMNQIYYGLSKKKSTDLNGMAEELVGMLCTCLRIWCIN